MELYCWQALKVGTKHVNIKLSEPVVHVNQVFHDTCIHSLTCIRSLETHHIQVVMDRLQHQWSSCALLYQFRLLLQRADRKCNRSLTEYIIMMEYTWKKRCLINTRSINHEKLKHDSESAEKHAYFHQRSCIFKNTSSKVASSSHVDDALFVMHLYLFSYIWYIFCANIRRSRYVSWYSEWWANSSTNKRCSFLWLARLFCPSWPLSFSFIKHQIGTQIR